MSELPPPPVPTDADLRHFPNMPLEVSRLRDSGIASAANPEVFRCAVLLWCAAWHQVPAGSLPTDDATLARIAGLGRDLRTWKRLRADVLRGFREFSDCRLYHRVICEKVVEGLNSTSTYGWNKICARIRKENNRNAKVTPRPAKVENPPRPASLTLRWPDDESSVSVRVTGHEPDAAVTRTGREYGTERKGMESFPRGATTLHPVGTVTDAAPPIAAGEGLGGSTRDTVPGMIVDLAAKMRVHP